MSSKLYYIKCPEYNFDNLNIEKVSKTIDDALVKYFAPNRVVIRAVQSAKHKIQREKLIKKILATGTDRFNKTSLYQRNVSDIPIDFYGLITDLRPPLTLSILEGFHKWKPMCLENPQTQADIWLVYDEAQVENIEYNHLYYNVMAKDGFRFKDKRLAKEALLGIVVIN